jgi:hypothetical protein
VQAILLSILVCCLFCKQSFAASEYRDTLNKSSATLLTHAPDKLFDQLIGSYDRSEKLFIRKSEKWIKRLQRQEKAFLKRVKESKDLDKLLPQGSNSFYLKIQQHVASGFPDSSSKVYIPQIDSLTVLAAYFNQLSKNGQI